MVKIDLITGFLGAGKTTFLKNYARYLMDRGEHIGILENDFGAVNVDMMLLQELEGEQCELEMISGGCERETHRRRFRTKLIAMGMLGLDRILVEPSGIYDVDEFFDALCESPLDQWYEAGNVIAVVDGSTRQEWSEEAEYLLGSEAADAGCVIVSRMEQAAETEIEAVLERLNWSLEQVQCARRITREELLIGEHGNFSLKMFERIASCGFHKESFRKRYFGYEEGFQSLFFMNLQMTEEELQEAVKKIFADASCGTIFRVKGFLRTPENGWLELNATQREIRMEPIAVGQEILIVIGEGLNRDTIESCLTTH